MENPKPEQLTNSPEFEFWMVRNPSFPQPNLLSADQLIVDGVLLPLRLLPHHHQSNDPPDPHPEPTNLEPIREPESEPASGPELSSSNSLTTTLTASKRWTDIFKKSDKKNSNTSNNHEEKQKEKEKEKEKKKERKGVGAGSGASSAELNINIWPFSRSRSAGNGGTRPRMAATRKVSSAPCSRSNSSGESKSRKWPSSPSRGGVHLGRSSPVWQVRRGGSGARSYASEPVARNAERGVKKEGSETRRSKIPPAGGDAAKSKVLNLNVPTCIGYSNRFSCRSDENSAVGVAAGAAARSGDTDNGGRGSNLFNLRSLFTKKVY